MTTLSIQCPQCHRENRAVLDRRGVAEYECFACNAKWRVPSDEELAGAGKLLIWAMFGIAALAAGIAAVVWAI